MTAHTVPDPVPAHRSEPGAPCALCTRSRLRMRTRPHVRPASSGPSGTTDAGCTMAVH